MGSNHILTVITPRWDADHLRSRFVRGLSDMYRSEVPLYGQLVDIVNSVDNSILAARGQGFGDLPVRHQLERHGAIRVGTEQEMRMISRLFGIMGMHPVGYYDLEVVGYASSVPLVRHSVTDKLELTCVTIGSPSTEPLSDHELRNLYATTRFASSQQFSDQISSPHPRCGRQRWMCCPAALSSLSGSAT